jgi:hypothetical protein
LDHLNKWFDDPSERFEIVPDRTLQNRSQASTGREIELSQFICDLGTAISYLSSDLVGYLLCRTLFFDIEKPPKELYDLICNSDRPNDFLHSMEVRKKVLHNKIRNSVTCAGHDVGILLEGADAAKNHLLINYDDCEKIAFVNMFFCELFPRNGSIVQPEEACLKRYQTLPACVHG